MNRSKLLKQLLKDRILVLDGATGTSIQNMNLKASDFGGDDLEGCNENLILSKPDAVRQVHNEFLEAGADIIETNTFGATPIVLEEYGLADKCYELNLKGAQIARECADSFSTESKPRFVAGSMGPTTKAISVTGGVTFSELVENFYQQAIGLLEGGVDYFLIETCQDTRNIKAAIIGVRKLLEEKNIECPIAVSGTIEASGTMLAGQDVEALTVSLEHIDLLYLGINCATGPTHMTDHIRTLASVTQTNIACVPNAGLPDEEGNYLESPEMVADALERFVDSGWINLLGGCCGTTPAHIKAMVEMSAGKKVRPIPSQTQAYLSGIDAVEITAEKRPILVGERTNVIGSKKFRNLITDDKFDQAAEIAKNQVKKGAEVVDVCLANPDSDELNDMKNFLEKVIHKVKVPLMIDSTDKKVIEEALTYSQGKAIINSINLEGDGKHFRDVAALAKKYGAALVVGTIDSEMAVSRQRKLEVATEEYKILREEFQIKDEDMYFDPLVFPCATGDEKYVGSAVETIEGIRLIKEKFPRVKSAIGVSNVSFGLPPAGREVLNSVFLYHCVQAGLDLAIVNTQKLKRFASIDKSEVKLAEDLLWDRHENVIADFANFYRDKKVTSQKEIDSFTPEERVANHIVEGTKIGIEKDLDAILAKGMEPLDIINGPLMNGMGTVGKLFNNNELIVAEVLQSAESMKTAVNYLQQFMTSTTSAKKAKFMIATVKGDVHDIGKNLVDIILSNNGYEVINLGIKVAPEVLIKAIREHKPDIVGLSGLLVKSAQQMIITADDLKKADINVPIMVGGAALSANFVNNKIAPAYNPAPVFYAKDAMESLGLCEKILKGELQSSAAPTGEIPKKTTKPIERPLYEIGTIEPPQPADYKKHVIKNTPIEQIFAHINPKMLLGKHLGASGKLIDLYTEGKIDDLKSDLAGKKLLDLSEQVESVKSEYGKSHLLPQAIYQYFKCKRSGDSIIIVDEQGAEHPIFFPRQSGDNGLCLSDFIMEEDNLCLFVVTVGKGIKDEVELLKAKDQYLKSHILGSLAIEAAEGYAELLHSQLRRSWGINDPETITMKDLFAARYRGKRYSFGYPACPDLGNQEILFKILNPVESIGVYLTEGMMMSPEASISAMVLHHPDAKYFAV